MNANVTVDAEAARVHFTDAVCESELIAIHRRRRTFANSLTGFEQTEWTLKGSLGTLQGESRSS